MEPIFVPTLKTTAEPSSPLPIICGNATENKIVNISCPASKQSISYVDFASYGTPTGFCGHFSIGGCNSASSVSVVSQRCIGKHSCEVPASYLIFGDPCQSTPKQLNIQVTCGGKNFSLTTFR